MMYSRDFQRQQQQEQGNAIRLRDALCDGELRSLCQRAPSESDLISKIAGIKGHALRHPNITASCPQLVDTIHPMNVAIAAPTPENFVFAQDAILPGDNDIVPLSDSVRADSPRPSECVNMPVMCEPVLNQFMSGTRRFVKDGMIECPSFVKHI